MMEPKPSGDVVVYSSKSKMGYLALVCLAFVFGGVWVAWNFSFPPNQDGFLTACAVLGILFFGFLAVGAAIRAFDSRPALILDDEGIVDNSTWMALGRIPLKDIAGFSTLAEQGQHYIVISLHEPDIYLERYNPFNRWLIAVGIQSSGVKIPTVGLELEFGALVDLVSSEFAKRGLSLRLPVRP